MVDWPAWLEQNWFGLIQTVGIVGGLVLTTASLQRDRRARRTTELLTLAGQHRELWSDAHRRADLRRIFQAELDLIADPISVAEEEFLNLVIVHFYTGWMLAKEEAMLTLKTLASDAGCFFSLPLPRMIWERTKPSRDPKFVRFIDKALAMKNQPTLLRRLKKAFGGDTAHLDQNKDR